jgi:hypothetical protein
MPSFPKVSRSSKSHDYFLGSRGERAVCIGATTSREWSGKSRVIVYKWNKKAAGLTPAAQI